MKMGYFLVSYGTELLKLGIQMLHKNSALHGILQAQQLEFLLLSGLSVKQGRLDTLLMILVLRNISPVIISVKMLFYNITGYAQGLTSKAKGISAVSSPLSVSHLLQFPLFALPKNSQKRKIADNMGSCQAELSSQETCVFVNKSKLRQAICIYQQK